MSFTKHQLVRDIARPSIESPPKTRTQSAIANEATILPIRLSLAVRVNNEGYALRKTLESVFRQSLFEELHRHHERCEIICISNGCTDHAVKTASRVFAIQRAMHPFDSAFTCRIAGTVEIGRNSVWNQFVHAFSSHSARVLCVIDSGVVFKHHETLFNMYAALLNNLEAQIASDRPCFAEDKTTTSMDGQSTSHVYCIRADMARRLWLPSDCLVEDDRFIRAVVCTDFFSRKWSPRSVIHVAGASYARAVRCSRWMILKDQKRQMVAKTVEHVLIEHLRSLPPGVRTDLAATLRRKEERDPNWLGRLVCDHVQRVCYFWRLFPGALALRTRPRRRAWGLKCLIQFSTEILGPVARMIGCVRAYRHFLSGQVTYLPCPSHGNIRSSQSVQRELRETSVKLKAVCDVEVTQA